MTSTRENWAIRGRRHSRNHRPMPMPYQLCRPVRSKKGAVHLAPIAPNLHLSRLLTVIEQLLRPAIYTDGKPNIVLRGQCIEPVHLGNRFGDAAFDAQRSVTRELWIIRPTGPGPISSVGRARSVRRGSLVARVSRLIEWRR